MSKAQEAKKKIKKQRSKEVLKLYLSDMFP
jgi:hypothetical protein